MSTAPDLWLLPGMDGTGRLYARLLRALAERGVRSPRVFSYDARASSYEALLEALPRPARATVVVGESFGGPLALRLASRDPELVSSVVLVASFVRPPRSLLRLAAALVRRAPTPPAVALRAAMIGRDADEALVGEVRAAIEATPRETIARRLEVLAALDATPDARALVAPLRVVVATHDRLVSEPRATEAARLARTAEVVRIEGPHLLAQARARALATFLSKP